MATRSRYKERLQAYSGTVISKQGSGINASIRVRRISFGEGVERVFLVHSPRIEKIEVTKIGDVRRAKLYYLRDRMGRKTRVLKQKLMIEGEILEPEPILEQVQEPVTGDNKDALPAPLVPSDAAAHPAAEKAQPAK